MWLQGVLPVGDAENVKKNVAKIDNTHGGRELC